MATLAEVLRQAGYVTPQGQVVGPRTTTAQTMSNYIRNIIPNAAQNLAQQRSDIDAALTMGQGGLQVGDKAAFERALEQVPNLMGSVKIPKNSVLVDIPLSKIEHGESATMGGKLTWPNAENLIKKYAEMKTDFPPIEVFSSESAKTPFMIYDGSHRFEAAKLRNNKLIKAYINKNDTEALQAYENLKNSRKEIIEQELEKVSK